MVVSQALGKCGATSRPERKGMGQVEEKERKKKKRPVQSSMTERDG